MGKQTAVALTAKDERAFFAFLQSIAEVRLLISSGPTTDALWVDSFDSVDGYAKVYIWNTAFPWNPVYGTVIADPSGTRNGYKFVRDAATAPVIEYLRHNFSDPKAAYGRVYWCKSSSAAPAYDVALFNKWYSAVVRWLRKHGKRAEEDFLSTYYLPDAWETHSQVQQMAQQCAPGDSRKPARA